MRFFLFVLPPQFISKNTAILKPWKRNFYYNVQSSILFFEIEPTKNSFKKKTQTPVGSFKQSNRVWISMFARIAIINRAKSEEQSHQ